MQTKKRLALIAILALASSALAVTPPYTSAQAAAGKKVYSTACSGCHGGQLQGGAGPALAGKTFLAKWGNRSLDDLYYIESSQMPLNAPGSLSDTQYLNILAYILQSNKIKAGKQPLTAAALKQHTVTK